MKKFDKKEFLIAFGENLKTIRIKKGLSQEMLAHKAEIYVSQIGRIERGEINPTIWTIERIANVLKVKRNKLFDF